ncbi:Aldo/keto reductase [Flagelloscypha sp. PMI_526]|nr:Aldo/keto reductase [Flagelloscypha sp. PMI_526]
MEYVRLGNSGLKVSKIILGCMSYGSPEWESWVLGEQEGIEHIKFAYENGINTFDTANVYSNGYSEIVLGKAIKALDLPRENIVVLTKVYFPVSDIVSQDANELPDLDAAGFTNKRGLSRKHIFASIKASLARLQLDYVDLLQCHRFDYDTPIEETMQALNDVVQAGYARYVGMSSCNAYQYYAITNKLTPFISMQNHYNLVYREEEREMFPTLKHFGVGSIPWSPLGRGFLTRPLDGSTKRSNNDSLMGRYGVEAHQNINKKVQELATKKGVSMAQVALAWVMAKEGVTAPIVGSTSIENLKDLLSAVKVKLDEDEIKALEAPYVPQPIIGHK